MKNSPQGVLERLGLHRSELRAWAMYDWANSAFITVVVAAVFPAFYGTVAAAGLPEGVAEGRFTVATSVAIVIAAVLSPILGAIADYRAVKKRMLGTFMGIGVTAVGCMFFISQGDWLLALVLFALGNIGAMGSFVFYDSLLPHIADNEEIDRVSTAGYAIGYFGGGILLAFNLAWITNPQWFGMPSGPDLTPDQATLPARLALLSVAVWWLAFSIPLFLGVREPAVKLEPEEEKRENPVRMAFVRLGRTFRELREFKHAFLVLLAFLIYSDGIGTIIRMAVIYGTTIGIDQNAMILAILITQFVGVPFAFLFGMLAGWIGPKRSIFIGLVVYGVITVVGYFMTTASDFILLAILVGMVQGGTQGLSRSLFGSMIPRHKSGEFFGFFGVMDRFSGSIGSAVLGGLIAVGISLRLGILTIMVFFIVGAILLSLADVDEGRRVAREAEHEARPVDPTATAQV